jgi:hypothetical protein
MGRARQLIEAESSRYAFRAIHRDPVDDWLKRSNFRLKFRDRRADFSMFIREFQMRPPLPARGEWWFYGGELQTETAGGPPERTWMLQCFLIDGKTHRNIAVPIKLMGPLSALRDPRVQAALRKWIEGGEAFARQPPLEDRDLVEGLFRKALNDLYRELAGTFEPANVVRG